jgi:hypothetical protein
MFKNLNKKKVLTMFIKYWFQYLLLSVFEDSIFIDFISNYNMCLRSRLEILSCKQIKPWNINIFLKTKTWKTKH